MAVPKLRFPLFTSNYSEVMLKDLLAETIKNGTQNKEGKNEHQIKFINVINLYSPLIKHSDLNFVDKDLKKIEHLLVRQGDLFFTRSSLTVGGIAHCNIYEDDYSPVTFDDHLMRVRVNIDKALPKYMQLASITPKSRKYLTRSAKTGTMTTIGQGELESFKLNLPTIDEQKKVVDFFDRINTKIALQKEKIDLLKEQKKWLMQKIFSQELRFKDKDGQNFPSWKKKLIGEIGEVIMGQSPDGNSYSEDPSDTVLVQGNADLKHGKIVPRIFTSKITKMASIDDIILTVRAPVGVVAKCNIPACIGRGVCVIRSDDFLYYYLDYFYNTSQWNKLSQGSTFESVNSNDIKNITVPQPSEPEKKIIISLFDTLTQKLHLAENVLSNLEKQKKAFMQQMFI